MSQQGGYAAHQVSIVVSGAIITGFADGDFVTADHDTDESEAIEGADSYISMSSRPADRLGTIEIVLAQTSLANNELQALTAPGVSVPVQVFNPQGGELASMPQARLKKGPPVKYGKSAGSRSWIFHGRLTLNRAGFDTV